MNYGLFVKNGWDGSANIQLCESYKLAQVLDDYYQEEGEGWGESSVTSIEKM